MAAELDAVKVDDQIVPVVEPSLRQFLEALARRLSRLTAHRGLADARRLGHLPEDGYTGVIRNVTMPLPPASITSVQVIDQLLTIQAAGPEGPLLIELAITNTGLEGTWAMGDGSGGITAIKTG